MKKIICLIMFGLSGLSAESAFDELFEKYSTQYDVPKELLIAIAQTESGFDPWATNKNTNGTFDIGLMQINTVHLPKLRSIGLKAQDLYRPDVNIAFSAYILSTCFDKHGFNWRGLNCYNGRIANNPYFIKVLKNLIRAMPDQSSER